MPKQEQQTGTVNARAYNMACLPYSQAGRITVVKNCFAFQAVNIGDTIAYVNNMILYPSSTPATALGDARTVSGHLLDLYKGLIKIQFAAPLGANPKVEITQLFYLEGDDINTKTT